jgi:phospholipid/cholesterol/gamma-HCH transport system substrate-binding protein
VSRTLTSRLRSVAVVAAVAVLASACTGSNGGGTKLTAYFSKAVSLYPQGQVRVLGLTSGRITRVRTEGNRVRVEMVMDKDVILPAGVKATIVPESLIGERYVQLFPAWTDGTPRAADGLVLGLDKTSIPVEPDEALAALKHLLDSLDPNATGRLVKNLADDLNGNGTNLNGAIKGLAQLSNDFAAKDQEIGSLVDHFDKFVATLDTREQQLGAILDSFATTTSLLAQERKDIEGLVSGLAQVSVSGLSLVSEHGPKLAHDIEVLTRTLQSVRANIDGVRALLASTPQLVAGRDLDGKDEGLLAAWDPHYHHLDLRNSSSPTVSAVLGLLGLGSFCIPSDVACPPGGLPVPSPASAGAPTQPASTTGANPATAGTPIDGVVDLLGSPTAVRVEPAAFRPPTTAALTSRSHSGALGWIRRAARLLVEQVS